MSRTSSNWHQRATWGMTIGLIAALSLLLLLRPSVLGWFSSSFEYDTLDFWFALRDARQSRSVSILAIDETTLRRWKGDSFRARDVARAIRLLGAAGTKGIALDLPQLCDPNLHFDGESDLLAAIKANGRVILPLELRPRSADEISIGAPSPLLSRAARVQIAQSQSAARRFATSTPFGAATSGLAPFATPSPVASRPIARPRVSSPHVASPGERIRGGAAAKGPTPRQVELPDGVEIYPAARYRLAAPSRAFLDAAAGAGHLTFSNDRFGRARRLPLQIGFQGRFYPAFSAAGASVAGAGHPRFRGRGRDRAAA